MPSFYTHGNDVYSTVATAPSPATSGTSLIVQAGDGSKFNNGWAWCWPANVQPLKSNCEVVLVTNISTDTLTITRAQQSSTARSIAIGYQIAQGLTKSDVEQIENAINYAADAGSTDAYAVTLAPVPTAYTTGQVVVFKANTVNTGAATLNVNGLGAKTIKKSVTGDLNDGDIAANQLVTVAYDGTNFQFVSSINSTQLPIVWSTWVPVIYKNDGTTVNTGNILLARYNQIGKIVVGDVHFSGIGDPSGTGVQWTPPVTPRNNGQTTPIGTGYVQYSGSTNSIGWTEFGSGATKFNTLVIGLPSWGNNNILRMNFTYEAA